MGGYDTSGGFDYTYNDQGAIETSTPSGGGDSGPMGPTGITYAADTWQGWTTEISAHSAGLESYTPPTSEGSPGVTQLTPAGAAALGLDPGGTYIETLSWGADVAVVLNPLPPSSVMMYGIDFTPLANAILTPIRDALQPILSSLQDILRTVGTKVVATLKPITDGIISSINDVLAASGKAGEAVGKTLDDTYATLKKSLDQGLKDLDNVWQNAWAQAMADINEVLRLAHQIDNGLGDIVIGAEELAGNMTRGFTTIDGHLKEWVPEAIFTALLTALDRAVSP